jgi:hypothetical protein
MGATKPQRAQRGAKLDMVGVTGSNPVAPTAEIGFLVRFALAALARGA